MMTKSYEFVPKKVAVPTRVMNLTLAGSTPQVEVEDFVKRAKALTKEIEERRAETVKRQGVVVPATVDNEWPGEIWWNLL